MFLREERELAIVIGVAGVVRRAWPPCCRLSRARLFCGVCLAPDVGLVPRRDLHRGALFIRVGLEAAMMQHMMDGGMMWGMGLGGLIALILLVLVIAALVKYVFFR
jgi:hypothetical protein